MLNQRRDRLADQLVIVEIVAKARDTGLSLVLHLQDEEHPAG